jgi:hypothetical protein
MKTTFFALCLTILLFACQPPADNAANEAFAKNSETVMAVLDGFQNENADYSMYAENFIMGGTQFGQKDTLTLEELIESDKNAWAGYDFELITEPLVLLPGVNPETRLPDGSVRYYGDWKVTRSATDTTAEKSGVVKLYQSFDFDEEGKIIYQQYYGDVTGLFMNLNSEN